MRTTLTVLLVCLMASLVMAQNPKPPTRTGFWGPDRLPLTDSVVLSVNGQNLTVYIDSTSNPADQNKLTTLEIKWEGPGGFVEENCDFDTIFVGDFDVCTAEKIAKVRSRGFGPIYNLGGIIPDGFSGWETLEGWGAAWIVDGSYLTGGTLDKFRDGSPYIDLMPEPSSLALLALGTLGLIAARRRF